MEAIVIGATGLIGSSLVDQLITNPSFTKVTAIVRKKSRLKNPKLTELVVDFENLAQYADELKADVVFCAIGTTKSKTPNQDQYKKIDYQYPLDLARIAFRNGATQYHLVSAMGADANSSIFYTKLKGEVERDLKTIPYPSIFIYQPSLLNGHRKESRPMEKILNGVMSVLNPLMIGELKQYRSIKIEAVASAMIKQALKAQQGIFTYTSDEIQALSQI